MPEVEFLKPYRGVIGGKRVRAAKGDRETVDERFLAGLRNLRFVKNVEENSDVNKDEGDKPEADKPADVRETRESKAEPEKRGPGRPPKAGK